MRHWLSGSVMSVAALLSACGGGGSSPPPPSTGPIGSVPTPPPPAPPSGSACSLSAQQNFTSGVIREWYLFPETLPAVLDPAPFTSVQSFIDALTATARSQGRDRFFTYATSIAEENAFFNSGATAGFGIRLAIDSAQRLFVSEAYEGGPALAVGIDRGTEILAIGTSEANLKTVASIVAAEGTAGIINALGPSTSGTTRVLRISDAAGTRTVTVAKTDFSMPPVSPRYGARIIDDGGKKVGYLNLRTFISTADPALRDAFASFRAQSITNIIVDFRYNGGGLVSTSELMGDLLGANRSTAEVLSFTTFRPEKSSNNSTRFFKPQPQSVAPTRLAFIGTGASASASEFVINAFIPYLGANAALIGTNTFGKPVGQSAFDLTACDLRLRVVTFKTENAAHEGEYFNGLASKVKASCKAVDDLSRQLGDPQEASTRVALDFLAGRACTPISSGIGGQSAQAGERRDLLVPDQPSTVQREVPGTF